MVISFGNSRKWRPFRKDVKILAGMVFSRSIQLHDSFSRMSFLHTFSFFDKALDYCRYEKQCN